MYLNVYFYIYTQKGGKSRDPMEWGSGGEEQGAAADAERHAPRGATHPLRDAEKVLKPSNPTFFCTRHFVWPTVLCLFGKDLERDAPRGATHPLWNAEEVLKSSNSTFWCSGRGL